MASLFGPGGGTYAGGRRRPTNAGPGPDLAVPTETRPVTNPTTTQPNDNPFGDTTTPGTGPGPYGAPTTGFPGQVASPTSSASSAFKSGPYNTPEYMGAYDPAKFASKSDPKYDLLRLESQFDPHAGLTNEFMQALNALGLGTFTKTSNDYATLSNGDPRWDGMTGADLIIDEGSPNARWGVGGSFASDGTPTSVPAESGGMPFDYATLAALLHPPQQAAPDLSWLGPLLSSLTRQPSSTTAVPRGTVSAPSMTGGYVAPGYGTVGDATQTMALSLPEMLRDPRYASDPFVQSILRLIAGGQ